MGAIYRTNGRMSGSVGKEVASESVFLCLGGCRVFGNYFSLYWLFPFSAFLSVLDGMRLRCKLFSGVFTNGETAFLYDRRRMDRGGRLRCREWRWREFVRWSGGALAFVLGPRGMSAEYAGPELISAVLAPSGGRGCSRWRSREGCLRCLFPPLRCLCTCPCRREAVCRSCQAAL